MIDNNYPRKMIELGEVYATLVMHGVIIGPLMEQLNSIASQSSYNDLLTENRRLRGLIPTPKEPTP